MIRHLVVFRFRDDVGAADREALLEELRRLPERFPVLRRFELGVNRSARDDRYSHAFVAEVDSMDELVTYLSSEGHERFVAERFRPLVEERAIVSFEVT